jgi:hypothetical protein
MTTLYNDFNYQHLYVIDGIEYYVITKFLLVDPDDSGYLFINNGIDKIVHEGKFEKNCDFKYGGDKILSGQFKLWKVFDRLRRYWIDPITLCRIR